MTELEVRRVLNGDGVVTELVVDAGDQAGDGHADSFDIDFESGYVTVSVNGETLEHTSAAGIDALRIQGSSDNDQIRLNFGDGVPDQFRVQIEGQGGDDQLVVESDSDFQSLIHAIRHPASGTLTAQTASTQSVVEYRDIESIEQNLDTAQLLVDLAQSNADAVVQLGSTGSPDGGTLFDVSADGIALSVSFENPSDSLRIHSNSEDGVATENRVEVHGDSSVLGADILIEGDELDQFYLSGELGFTGENFEVDTGSILWDARVSLESANLNLTADASIELTESSQLSNTDGQVWIAAESIRHDGEILAHGGEVHLDSGELGTTLVNGLIDASSITESLDAGEVRVLGMHVGLLEGAVIDVSGVNGGGTALIGGDYQGQNDSVLNAQRTYVSAHAVVLADAGERGDGGRVIVWADEWTRFSGTVSARGGRLEGGGGFVEISGKQSLDFHGTVDLAADNGDVGMLLLDPRDITIVAASSDDAEVSGDSEALFDDGTTTQDFTISASAFQTSTANITLQATRDITVDEAITLTQSGITFALQAGRNIAINASITGAGSNQFIFEADSVHTTDGLGGAVGATSSGQLSIAAVTVDSSGGDIHLLAETFAINTSASIAAGAGDVYLAESDGGGFGSEWSSDELGTISSTGTLTLGRATTAGTDNTGASAQTITNSSVSVGDRTLASTVASTIRFIATGAITFTGDVTTNQAVEIIADSDANGVGTFTVNSNDPFDSNDSDVTITAAGLALNSTFDAGTGTVAISTSTGTDIGVGDASVTGMNISRNEFARITAEDLTLETAGAISVDDIRAANSNLVSGTVTLRATGSGSTVEFVTAGSTFNALSVEATDGVTVEQDLTTDVGGITIDADTDSDGVGTFSVSASRTVDSGDAAIEITADTIDLSGSLDSGTGEVTLQDSHGGGINFGSATGAFDFTNTELGRITAANLTLQTTGDINVAGIAQTSSVGGSVTLLANGASSDVTFGTTASSFRTLSVQANEGISVDVNLSSTEGAMTLNANLDAGDGQGTLSIASGVTVDSDGEAIDIAAEDLDLVGSINAGASAISITESEGGGVLFGTGGTGTQLELTGTELGQLTATGLSLISSGAVEINEITAAESDSVAGTVSIQSTQSVTLVSGRTAIFNALSIAAEQGVAINGSLSTDTGDLALDGDSNDTADGTDTLTFASGVQVESAGLLSLDATSGGISGAGDLTLYANDGITVSANLGVTGASGVGLTVDADRDAGDGVGTFTVGTGLTVSTNSTTLDITANDIDLLGSLDAGTASATISGTNGVGLGDSAVAGGMHFSKTELQQLTAADLTVEAGGNLVVDHIATSDFANNISLAATGASSSVTFSGQNSSFRELSVQSSDGVQISVDVNTTVGGVTIDADSDAGDNAGTLSISATVSLTSNNQDVVLTANDVAFSGNIDAGTGNVTITDSDGTGIGLGLAVITGGLNLDQTDLDNVTADTLLLSTTQDIQVNGVTPAASISTLSLDAAGSVAFVNNASSFGELTVGADDGIDVDVDLTATNLTLDGDANATVDTNDDIVFADGVQVAATSGTSGTLTLRSQSGGMSGVGALTLSANDGVSLEHALSVTGTLTIDSDVDANDNVGTLSVAGSLSTSNQQITITANDVDLSGSIDSGTGNLSVQDSDGTGIDLGSSMLTGGLAIDNTEIANITANDLGFQTIGDIGVGAVTQPGSVAGLVQLDATGTTSQVVFDSGASTFTELVANANEGISVGFAVNATAGSITLDSDADASGAGDLSIAAAGSLSTSNQNVTLTAHDVDLQGAVQAGTGAVSIIAATNQSIGLGTSTQTLHLDGSEFAQITAATLNLSTGTRITSNGMVAANSANIGTVALDAGQDIDFESSGNEFSGLAASAADGVALNGDLSTSSGSLSIDGDSNNTADASDQVVFAAGVEISAASQLTLDATTGLIVANGALDLFAADGITINDSLTGTSGDITINADTDANDQVGTLSVAGSATIQTNGNNAFLTANDIDLSGTIDTGVGQLQVTDSDGDGIGLGTASPSNGIQLSAAEVQRVTATDAQFQSTGVIEVDQLTSANSNQLTGTTTLVSDATISFLSNGASFHSLSVAADQGILLSGDLSTSTGALSLDGDANNAADAGADSIDIASGVTIEAATTLTLDAQTGMITSADATLRAAEGITLNDSFTATGAVVFEADTTSASTGVFTLASSVALTSSGAISISADDLALGGTIDSGTATTTVTESDGDGIGLGDAVVAGGLNLDSSELNAFSAGDLEFVTTGNVQVDNGIQSPGVSGSTVIRSGGTISFDNQASTFVGLTAEADDGILVNVALTTSGSDLSLDGDANNATDTSDSITIAASVGLDSAGQLTLAASGNGISSAGALTLTANDGVTLEDDLTAGGTLTILADDDSGDDVGTFQIDSGASVTSTASVINVTANDLAWQGSIGDASTVLSITDSDGDGIGLGASLASGIEISGSELQTLVATDLNLTTGGAILVEGISAANSNSISGTVSLSATNITFNAGSSTFNTLEARASDGLTVNGDLTTDTGLLLLDGDSNNTDDAGSDDLQIGSGVQIQAATSLTLNAQTGAIGSADATLLAANGITLSHSLTATGALSINADVDGNVSAGAFTLLAGADLTTADQTLSISADDLSLGGSISSGASNTTITETDGDGIGLGDATVAGGLNLDGTELLTFTADDLELVTTGNVEVENGVQSTNVAGATLIQAGGTVTFSNQASTFTALTANADDGVVIDADVTTTSGDLLFDGDADGATDTVDSIRIGSSASLQSAGLLSLAASTGGISSTTSLTLDANDGVTVSDGLAVTGTLTINADVDNGDGDGTFTIGSSAAVTATGLSIDVTANQIDWQGTIGDPSTALSLTDSDGGGIGIGVSPGAGGIEITGSELQSLTATDLSLTTSGSIQVQGITAANSNNISGTVRLNANDITFNAGASTFNAIEANADNGIVVDGNLTTDVGTLVLEGDQNGSVDGSDSIQFAASTQLQSAATLTLSASSGGLSGAGALALLAADGLTINDSLSVTGALSLDTDTDAGDDSGTLSVASGATVSATTIDATANDIALSGSLDSGLSSMTIRDSDGSGIGLGTSTIANGIHLDNTELQQLTASDLAFVTAGDLLVDGIGVPASITGTVTLTANGTASTISFANSASNFGALDLNASDGVSIDADLTVSGAISVSADTDAGDQIGTFGIGAGVTVDTNSHSLAITANDIDFVGSLQTGTASVAIVDADGSGIGFGDTPLTDGLNIDGSELQQITSTGLLLQTSGSVTVDNISAANSSSISGATTISASGSITFTVNDSTFNALTANADDRITLNGDLATDSGDLSLDGDANDAADTNDDIVFATGSTLSSAGALTIAATTGGMSSPTALTLQAADGITISDSLTTVGALTINADTDAGDDNGLLSVLAGVVVDTNDNALDVTVSDFNNLGSFDSGTASTTIRDSDGDGIGLGDGTITGGINLTNTDLASFTADGLSLVTAGDMLVDGFSQSGTISGTTSLSSSGTITFSGANSSFVSLTANASDRIQVSTDLSTTVGDLNLDGDADDVASTNDDVQFAANVQVTSAGAMTLEATTGDLHGQGDLTLQAVDGITLNDSLTVDGVLVLNSDTDASGAGTLTVNTGATLATNDQAMTLTVGDLDIFGGASSGTATTTIEDSDGAGIGLGDAIIVGGLNLSVTDLQDFTAGGLVLNTAGNIEVDNMSQPATLSGTTELNATGASSTVSFLNNASSFNTLSVAATDGVSVQANLASTVGSLTINADSDANDDDGTLLVAAGVTLSTPNQALTLTANDIDLSGSLDSGSAATTIEDSDGDGIGLGDTSVTDGLNLTSAGMLNITANGLVLRSSNLILVDNVTQPNSIAGTTLLESGDQISFVNNASTFTTLDVRADDQIAVNVDIATSSGDLTLDGDANDSADSNDSVQFGSAIRISSAGTLSLHATTGGLTGAGALDLEAADGVTLNDSLAAAGTLTINADTDAGDGIGDFVIQSGAAVSTSNQQVSVTADSVTLSGTLDAGTTAITIIDSDSGGIGLGDASLSGGLNLTNASSANLLAADVTLTTSGNLTVENFSQTANVTGGYDLQATGSSSFITFQNSGSTFDELSLSASDGIAVSADLTVSTNGLQVNADTDAGDNLGTFAISSGVTVDTSGQSAAITSNDVDLLGSLNAGVSQVTFTDSDGSGIRIGDTGIGSMNVGQSEMDAITANDLSFVTSGSIVVNGVSQSISPVATTTLTADQSVSFSSNASSFASLSVLADDGISVAVGLSTTIGDLTLDGDADNAVGGSDAIDVSSGVQIDSAGTLDLDATNGGISGAGALTLNAADGVNVNDALVTSGALVINSDSDAGDGLGSLTVASTASITSNNQSITITADDVSFLGTVDAGSASTSLIDSDGSGIGLGASSVSGGLNLSNTDLSQITTSEFSLTTTGDITANSVSQPASISGTTSLFASGTVAFVSGSSSFEALDVQANDGVFLNVNVVTQNGDLAIDGDANDSADSNDQVQIATAVQLTSAGELSIDSTTGGITAAGTLGLFATDGVTIDAALSTAGALTIDADTDAGDNDGLFSVTSSGSIDTNNSQLQITANDVALIGGVQTGTAATTIVDSDGSGVDLADSSSTGRLQLEGSELQNLVTNGLSISTSGDVVLADISATESATVTGTTTITANGAAAVTSAVVFHALDLSANNGIDVSTDIETVTGDLDLDGDANDVSDGTDRLTIASGVTLTSASSMSLDATTGGISGAGTLSLVAADGITVTDSLTSDGTLTIDADSDAGDNVGSLTVTTGVSTNNQNINIVANDVQLNADLNAGTASVTIADSDGSGVGLGNSTVTNGLNLSNTDLNRIVSTGATLSTSGDFSIDGLSQGATISDTLALVGNGVASNAVFSGSASSAETLSVNVTGAVSVNADVTMSSGSGTIVAGGNVDVSAGTQLTGSSGQSLSVTGASITLGSGSSGNETLNITGGGSVTVEATGGSVQLGDNAVASDSGAISITASGDIDESADNDVANVSTTGTASLTAGGSIGQTASANLAGTGALDISVSAVDAESTSAGGIHLRSPGDITVQRLVTNDGDIELLSTASLDVQGTVVAGGSGNVELRSATMNFASAGDVTAGGTIDVVASSSGGLVIDNDAVFQTSQGSVGGQLVNSTNPFDGTADTGSPLTDSNREAQITVVIADSQATNIDIQIDWQEGDSPGPVVLPAPGDDRTQVIQSTVSTASGTVYTHEYENAPDPSNPSADINVTLSIIDIAAGTINLLAGGTSVFQATQFSDQVVVLEVDAAILPLFISIPETDEPESIATSNVVVQQVPEALRSFTAESTQILNSSIGTSEQSNERFYVLRIVSFGSEGEVKIMEEGQEYRLPDLEDAESMSGFELSQLPELFERLPDDRYRVYMVEGQMERLVLDFIIRDGQPIEAGQLESADESGPTSTVSSPQEADEDEEASADVTEVKSAVERLGEEPTVSAAGLLLTPTMISLGHRHSRNRNHTIGSSERPVK